MQRTFEEEGGPEDPSGKDGTIELRGRAARCRHEREREIAAAMAEEGERVCRSEMGESSSERERDRSERKRAAARWEREIAARERGQQRERGSLRETGERERVERQRREMDERPRFRSKKGENEKKSGPAKILS